ncbi:aminotransferase class IV family protein [Streptomyces sp. NPDC001700]
MAELNGQPADPDALATLALTNYGHFTSMRVDDQRVRGLSHHLERLARDCAAVFGADLDPDLVRRYVRQAAADRGSASVVRVTIFDPGIDLGHPSTANTPNILVTARPAPALPLPPLRVKTIRYERDAPAIKHTGLFGSLHTRRAAQLDGYDDALFTTPDGRISEGPTWNVGFISDDDVIWPEASVLPGVTMALLQHHTAHTTAPITPADTQHLHAAFATNTSIGVRALSTIDETPLPPEHPQLARLRDTYLTIPGEPL